MFKKLDVILSPDNEPIKDSSLWVKNDSIYIFGKGGWKNISTNGDKNIGIQNIKVLYSLSTSPSTEGIIWTEDKLVPDDINKYLWMKFLFTLNDSTQKYSNPIMISNYANIKDESDDINLLLSWDDYEDNNKLGLSAILGKDLYDRTKFIDSGALESFGNTYITDTQIQLEGEGDLFKVIKNRIDAGYTYIDLRALNRGQTYTVVGIPQQPNDMDGTPLVDFNGDPIIGALVIDRPVEIVFNLGNIIYNGPHHMIIIASDGVKLTGHNRMGRINDLTEGTSQLIMTNNGQEDLNLRGYHTPKYHIYCRGYNNAYIQNITFKGIRSTRGCQFGSTAKPLLGCGGLYFEKPNPMKVSSGNTVNNLQINNVSVFSTIAHGIYVNTPILSNIRNTRVSDAGGYGIFIQNGTTLTLDTVFVTSANFGGFLIMGLSYLNLMNCASENNGLGYWFRSCQNVTAYSPGAEELVNLGENMWSAAKKETGSYGLNLSTTGGLDRNGNTDDRGTIMRIMDVNTDYYSRFRGTAFLITGGNDITLMTPYATIVGDNSYTGSFSTQTYFMRIDGNCRGLYILNPGFHYNSAWLQKYKDNNTVPLIKNEIYISSAILGATIYYNVDNLNVLKTLESTFGSDYGAIAKLVTYDNEIAPIRLTRGCDVEVKAGNRYFTENGIMNILYREAPELAEIAEISDIQITNNNMPNNSVKILFKVITTNELEECKILYSNSSIDITDNNIYNTLSSSNCTLTTETQQDDTYFSILNIESEPTYMVISTNSVNVIGEHIYSYSEQYLFNNGILTKNDTGEIILDNYQEANSMMPSLIEYIESTNTYKLKIDYTGYRFNSINKVGVAYSTTNTKPTTSQNKAEGILSSPNDKYFLVDVQGSTRRYIRPYINNDYTNSVWLLQNGELTIYSNNN